MTDNKEIRQEMEQMQAELQSALKEIIALAKKDLKPAEIKEIEEEFQDLDELLERLKTGLVWVALFGKTSVGKSAIANSLIDQDIAEVGVQHDLTTEPTPYRKEPWNIVDVPGVMGEIVNEEVAVDEAKKAHGLVFVIDGEPLGPELKLFELVHEAVPNVPKIVFVNKWDVKEFQHDENELAIVRQRITEKMGKFVRSPEDILYGNARVKRDGLMVRQKLPQLVDKMYEDAGTLGQIMNVLDPANLADDLSQSIYEKILEARVKVARKVVNGFALAGVASEMLPFAQLITTPGILASMVFTVINMLGKKASKEDSQKITMELLKACGEVLGIEFTVIAGADLMLDVATVFAGPFGAAVALLVNITGLSYYKYQRIVLLGEVTIDYILNDYSWAGSQRAVIQKCKKTASQHYFSIQKNSAE
jgi:GTP-binding protein EngB required for normal cell division/uncharacterized protein (DUF697 family)